MNSLTTAYERILAGLNPAPFDPKTDKYSGVFLPVPFEPYWNSRPKVMLVGRETAGWNTDNGKNTIHRVIHASDLGGLGQIVKEATGRYLKHLEYRSDGRIKTTSPHRLKQYFFQLARELDVNPEGIFYANLFAWDYNKGTPNKRPSSERAEIISISNQLLATQIKHLNPDFIIFATGYEGIDPIIRLLFNDHFDGYKNTSVVPEKLWEFKAAGSTCFRIAHPRATHGHQEFRGEVISRIKQYLLNSQSLETQA
ncbi:uracil-DNA glycosylase family protein [Marinobacter shengliensis]|uniref:hypothetical protein n=1 Tax=Marinobacter shengliensis TaxID=1389223 RepID=UPI001BB26B6C|nr:hypothetical protein [Marinobacter shengliensis]